MKRKHQGITVITFLATAVLLISPLVVRADDLNPPALLSPIIVTEIQPGSANSASEEFIELYNTTNQPIDLGAHHWRLEIASSHAADWSAPYRTIELVGVLDPATHYVVASKYTADGHSVQYLSGAAQAGFSAGLAASAGHVRLLYTTNQLGADASCRPGQTVVDEVEWSTPANGQPATPSLDSRTMFVTATTGGIANISSLQRVLMNGMYIDTGNDAVDFSLSTATPDQESTALPSEDASDAGNTNAPEVVGLPSSGCTLPPPAGGQGGEPENPSEQPDQDTEESDTPSVNAGLALPFITELLANPGSPYTDADDEYVELYNPNTVIFDLTDYVLQAGLTATHKYLFPSGAVLPPQSFTALFSRDTGLSLTNTGGQVSLLDPLGKIISQTDPYGTAPEGQAWALTGDTWHWSTTPTPGTLNTVTAPVLTVAKKVATAAKSTAKTAKTTAVKGTTAKPKSAAKPITAPKTAATASPAKFSPLHPGVLATVGIFAILYGAYEYRHDVANKLRNFRANRAARRKTGP